jgi:endonuclease/exonuclease/phosphatase family metal-dependent hydrolase
VTAQEIADECDKEANYKFPLIVAGDMNCEPANVRAAIGRKAKVGSSGAPTRLKSGRELDFIIVYGGEVAAHKIVEGGNISDHQAASFVVTL